MAVRIGVAGMRVCVRGASFAVHPAGIAVDVVLLLPDRHAMLHFIDDVAACGKRFCAMSGADADPNGKIADLKRSDAMKARCS